MRKRHWAEDALAEEKMIQNGAGAFTCPNLLGR